MLSCMGFARPWAAARLAIVLALMTLAVGALSASAQAAAPANDNLANAVSIAGASGTTTGSDAEATFEANETSSLQTFGTEGNVWYSWTAPQSGFVAFRTTDPHAPSSLDTVLGADTGSDITALTPVKINDDYPNCCMSRVLFNATQGTTYNISVGAFTGDPTPGSHAGDFGLEWGASDYYDQDNPVVKINSVTPGKRTFSVTFAAGDGTANIVGASWLHFDCKVDSGSFSPCTNPFTANVPGGSHTFAIRATDGAGNVGTATGTVNVKGGHHA
jgi:hypothetical protein